MNIEANIIREKFKLNFVYQDILETLISISNEL